MEKNSLCEYPADPSALGRELSKTQLLPDGNGRIQLPDVPGLGIDPDPEAIEKYLVDVEIQFAGKRVYKTPSLVDG